MLWDFVFLDSSIGIPIAPYKSSIVDDRSDNLAAPWTPFEHIPRWNYVGLYLFRNSQWHNWNFFRIRRLGLWKYHLYQSFISYFLSEVLHFHVCEIMTKWHSLMRVPYISKPKLVYSMVVRQVSFLSCDCQEHLFDSCYPSLFAISVNDDDQLAYFSDIFSKILPLP